jgi:pimeloyl-ACP methyl ester carboxylesterase
MTTAKEMQIEGHKLVTLSFNPDTPGSPIILLHGIIASVHFWSPDLLAPYTRYGPCYALSLPGHYPAAFPSNFSQDSLTAEMIAHTLTAAIRQLVGDQPVILVGHSTGGFAALDIAIHAPKVPQGVISISGFAHGLWTGWLGMYQWLARQGWPGQLLFRSLFKLGHIRTMYRATARFYAANPRQLMAYPHFEQMIDSGVTYFRQLALDAMVKYFAVMPNIDVGSLLTRIVVPTLVLTGDCDPIAPPSQSHLIAKQVLSAELAVVREAGHFPFFEKPDEYQLAIDGWLRQHAG